MTHGAHWVKCHLQLCHVSSCYCSPAWCLAALHLPWCLVCCVPSVILVSIGHWSFWRLWVVGHSGCSGLCVIGHSVCVGWSSWCLVCCASLIILMSLGCWSLWWFCVSLVVCHWSFGVCWLVILVFGVLCIIGYSDVIGLLIIVVVLCVFGCVSLVIRCVCWLVICCHTVVCTIVHPTVCGVGHCGICTYTIYCMYIRTYVYWVYCHIPLGWGGVHTALCIHSAVCTLHKDSTYNAYVVYTAVYTVSWWLCILGDIHYCTYYVHPCISLLGWDTVLPLHPYLVVILHVAYWVYCVHYIVVCTIVHPTVCGVGHLLFLLHTQERQVLLSFIRPAVLYGHLAQSSPGYLSDL